MTFDEIISSEPEDVVSKHRENSLRFKVYADSLVDQVSELPPLVHFYSSCVAEAKFQEDAAKLNEEREYQKLKEIKGQVHLQVRMGQDSWANKRLPGKPTLPDYDAVLNSHPLVLEQSEKLFIAKERTLKAGYVTRTYENEVKAAEKMGMMLQMFKKEMDRKLDFN